jgi:ubiquinone/menaquinone biosynthesis C-methylase UbiE
MSCVSSDLNEFVKKTYGQLWAKFDQALDTPGQLTCDLAAHDVLIEELGLTKGMKVLDVGSGSGETILRIADKVGPMGKAVGIDFTQEAVKLGRAKTCNRKLEKIAEFHQANALDLPFPDNMFDAVVSECTISLVQDKQKVLNQMVRVLKFEGKVIMHDVITWAPMPETIRNDKKLCVQCIGGAVSLKEMIKIMEAAGLRDIRTIDYSKRNFKSLGADVLTQALDISDDQEFQKVVEYIRRGGLGYALLIGTKSASF